MPTLDKKITIQGALVASDASAGITVPGSTIGAFSYVQGYPRVTGDFVSGNPPNMYIRAATVSREPIVSSTPNTFGVWLAGTRLQWARSTFHFYYGSVTTAQTVPYDIRLEEDLVFKSVTGFANGVVHGDLTEIQTSPPWQRIWQDMGALSTGSTFHHVNTEHVRLIAPDKDIWAFKETEQYATPTVIVSALPASQGITVIGRSSWLVNKDSGIVPSDRLIDGIKIWTVFGVVEDDNSNFLRVSAVRNQVI